jgi:hypothetical protein
MAAWLPVVTTIASTIFSANAARQEGKQRQAALEYSAKLDEQNAGQRQAASQRAAAEERRRGILAQSRALAVAAASGASASDPTVVDIVSDLNAEGTYRGMLALYQGEDEARQLRQSAATKRYGGEVAREAGNTNAVASILKGGSSLFMKYAPGGKTASPGIGYGSIDPTQSGLPGVPY